MGRGIRLVEVQAGVAHEGLDGRTRRIGALQGAVVERARRVVEQLAVEPRADAADEGLGVESRLADQRQHFAGRGIDGGDRAVEIAQRALGDVLELRIEREEEIATRRARSLLQLAERPAGGIGLDDARARRAAQLILVALLDAELADEVDALVLLLVELGVVGLADAADVADEMARLIAQRVGTREACGDVDALEGEAVDLEACELLRREIGLERDAAVARRLLGAVAEAC